MTLIEDREAPPDVPTTNELDKIDDPDLNQHGLSIDRYLAFGTTPRALPNPPKDGEVVVYKVKVECVGQAHKRRSDGEVRYRSELEILSVARVDEDLPPDFAKSKKQTKAEKDAEAKRQAEAKAEAAKNQPELFDEPPEEPDDQSAGTDSEELQALLEEEGAASEQNPDVPIPEGATVTRGNGDSQGDSGGNVVAFGGGPAFSDGGEA